MLTKATPGNRACTPRITGTGAAEKTQIQHMVKQLLSLSGELAEDAADALAVALCHAHSRSRAALLGVAAGAPP